MQDFSTTVKQVLKNKKKSVNQLANDVDKSIPYIYDLLRGARRWNEPLMKEISKVLGITIEYKIS